ncbi:hypothetical protein KC19_8G059100 [Ceratodon purpureus]|uniref:Uncharacterized protein n=1 Tax=Ceratodon purpureus TaxID=3225 RepID=A0A8T0GYZ9_CERPU|nr:hypothetical protein KC19_8G059100 [Ceratodon purpureus]
MQNGQRDCVAKTFGDQETIAMAACAATSRSPSALARCIPRALPISPPSHHLSASFPVTVTPLRVESLGRRGVVVNSYTSVQEGRVEDDEEDIFGDEEQVHYAQIDAFTDRAYSGNPAAVLVLNNERDDKWLQMIAREFNLSETAFLVKKSNTRKGRGFVQVDESGKGLKATKTFGPKTVENEFQLRWFTPTVEVDLCGHATLASAHLLFASGLVEGDTAIFHTRSGILKAVKVSGYLDYQKEPEEEELTVADQGKPSSKGVVLLDFPLAPPTACDDALLLSEALGEVEVKWVGMSSVGDYLVELQSSEDVENINPKFEKMLDLPGRGVIVTAPAASSSEFDFISRFFCPKLGVKEDPATGSAHCTLGPYWASKLGKTELNAYQASERGGKFLVRVDEEGGRCYLEGGAILVMAGILGTF